MTKPAAQSPKILEDILALSKQSVLIFSRDGVCTAIWGNNPLLPQPLRGTNLGVKLTQLVEEQHLESVKSAFEYALESDLPQSLVLESKAPGVFNLIEVIFFPLRSNNSTQIAACFRNANWARHERARDLEASTALQALKAAAKIGSFVIDLGTAQVSVCENYRKIFEIEENTLSGKDLVLHFFGTKEAKQIENGLERCLLLLETFTLQLQAQAATGKKLFVEFFAEPEQNDLGVVHRIRGFVQNIDRFAKTTVAAPTE